MTRWKEHRIKRLCLILAFLMLFCTLLALSSGRAHADTVEMQDYDLVIRLKIEPASANTPDPGHQVFHFNIWAPAGIPITIKNNAVDTYGYGITEGHLTFSAPVGLIEDYGVSVQQYDGNENWIFDMHTASFFMEGRTFNFRNLDYVDFDPGYDFVNTYNPVAPPVPERVSVTVPAIVRINKSADSVPDPGAAVFHFNIWSDSGADIQIVNNAVWTNGTGEFGAYLEFTVPSGQLDALRAASLHIQQYDGNADWRFDTSRTDLIWNYNSGNFMRSASAAGVYVTNTYAPPQPVQPADPEPQTNDNPDDENPPEPPEDDGTTVTVKTAELTCSAKQHKAYLPRSGERYYTGEAVALWVTVRNDTADKKNVKNIYFYDSSGDKAVYDPHLYYREMAGRDVCALSLNYGYGYTFMYYHTITSQEAKDGKYVFEIYAEGVDANGDAVISNTVQMEFETGVSYSERIRQDDKDKPSKKHPTIELRESTQPAYLMDDMEFYTLGDTVRFKVVIKNDTEQTFTDIEVSNDLTDEIHVYDELEPDDSKYFYIEYHVEDIVGKKNRVTCNAWMTYTDENGKERTKHARKCQIITAYTE